MHTIPYGRQHITDDDIEAVVETLKSDYLTQGPKITEFESKFAEYCGAKYAVAVANGTAALHICALALGVKKGQRVITTPITFVASANGFRYCGAEISFCDIDPMTHLLDLDKLELMLSAAVKGTYNGIVPVDFAGYPIHAEKLRKIADKYDLWIVEDACHSPGGYFTDSKGVKQLCGSSNYVDMTVFSFHPVKHIATGEGGMITTNNPELYKKLSLYRTHGITKDPEMMSQNDGGWYYEMVDLGYNYRITDFQAALGISQLSRANEGLDRRHQIADKYNKAFAEITQIRTPFIEKGYHHAYHLYVIEIPDRKALYEYLRENRIFAQVHYVPAHKMPYYTKNTDHKIEMPVSENYYAHCLSLPMFPSLTEIEQEYVIKKISDFFTNT